MAMVRQVRHERVMADYLWFARFTTNWCTTDVLKLAPPFVLSLSKDNLSLGVLGETCHPLSKCDSR